MDIKVDKHTAVVFDLDDTLYPEITFLTSAFKQIAQILDPKNDCIVFANMMYLYRSKQDVFAFLASKYSVDKLELLEIYRNHLPEIVLRNGVLPIFEAVKEKNGKIGILTDGRSNTQRNKLKALNILSFVDFVSISEEIEAEKPSEKGFISIMERFGCNSYWYIADNLKKDFVAPNRLGWSSLALLDSGQNIHSAAVESLSMEQLPTGYIYSFLDLNIV